jgi:hypothetical protein
MQVIHRKRGSVVFMDMDAGFQGLNNAIKLGIIIGLVNRRMHIGDANLYPVNEPFRMSILMGFNV